MASEYDKWWKDHVVVIGPDKKTTKKLEDSLKSKVKDDLTKQAIEQDEVESEQ